MKGINMSEYLLTSIIIQNSISDNWKDAVLEWEITDIYVDYDCSNTCICGHEHIKYCFTIYNEFTQQMLYPIGSRCIKKFHRKDLDLLVDVHEQMAQLLEHVKHNKFIEFNSKLFSRKLLKYLYDNGCFKPTRYNHFDPYNDYEFILDMFNKKNPPTSRQFSKVKALIMNNIIPYCKSVINTEE